MPRVRRGDVHRVDVGVVGERLVAAERSRDVEPRRERLRPLEGPGTDRDHFAAVDLAHALGEPRRDLARAGDAPANHRSFLMRPPRRPHPTLERRPASMQGNPCKTSVAGLRSWMATQTGHTRGDEGRRRAAGWDRRAPKAEDVRAHPGRVTRAVPRAGFRRHVDQRHRACRRARRGTGSFYRYFRPKDDVFVAAVQRSAREYIEEFPVVLQELDTIDDPVERLRRDFHMRLAAVQMFDPVVRLVNAEQERFPSSRRPSPPGWSSTSGRSDGRNTRCRAS